MDTVLLLIDKSNQLNTIPMLGKFIRKVYHNRIQNMIKKCSTFEFNLFTKHFIYVIFHHKTVAMSTLAC